MKAAAARAKQEEDRQLHQSEAGDTALFSVPVAVSSTTGIDHFGSRCCHGRPERRPWNPGTCCKTDCRWRSALALYRCHKRERGNVHKGGISMGPLSNQVVRLWVVCMSTLCWACHCKLLSVENRVDWCHCSDCIGMCLELRISRVSLSETCLIKVQTYQQNLCDTYSTGSWQKEPAFRRIVDWQSMMMWQRCEGRVFCSQNVFYNI